jgi:hypothetical protein
MSCQAGGLGLKNPCGNWILSVAVGNGLCWRSLPYKQDVAGSNPASRISSTLPWMS